jgi:hypothetical protein
MEAENKMTCACGSVVLKKNLASHIKTKKHQALAGPPSLHRGVSFADAQHTDRADVEDDDDDEGSEDDGDEDLDELFGIIEELTKAIFTLDKKNPASAFKAHIEERQSEREREKSNSKSKLKKQVSQMRNSIAASTNIFNIFFSKFSFYCCIYFFARKLKLKRLLLFFSFQIILFLFMCYFKGFCGMKKSINLKLILFI